MKVIVTLNDESREVNCGIYVYSLPSYLFFVRMFPKLISKRIKKFGNIFYATDNLTEKKEIYKILDKELHFSDNTRNVFLDNLDKIILKMNLSSKLKICIISDSEDERVYAVINKISVYSKSIYLVTDSESFFDKICENTLQNYGIGVILKKYSEIRGYDFGIILNSKYTDFENTAKFIVNLSDQNISAEYEIDDLIPYNSTEISNIKIKKYSFLEKNCENFNLSWKKSQKKLTNPKNSI